MVAPFQNSSDEMKYTNNISKKAENKNELNKYK